MEATKLVFVLLSLVVLNQAMSFRHPQRCPYIQGRKCFEDDECACPGESLPLICNYGFTCQRRSLWDDIIRKQPCFRVYKSWCSIDVDCPPCDEAPLICEQNECVKARYMVA